jgi:5-(carboxyamino)imidazole ribonucleotide synthase
VAAALAVEGAHLHLYDKAEVRPGRKMGHVTALGATPGEALDAARRAAAAAGL